MKIGAKTYYGLILGFLLISNHSAEANPAVYGIIAKQQHVSVPTPADMHAWNFRPSSLIEFINTVQQSRFQTIGSGEDQGVYYVVFRAPQDVLVFAYAFKGEEKTNGGYDLTGNKGSDSMIERESSKAVDLVDIYVETQSSMMLAGITASKKEYVTHCLIGYVFRIKNDYAGPLTLKSQLWNQGKDTNRLKFSTTVNWAAAS
jgi:hypothetical protein